MTINQSPHQTVLIASSHPLFGEGLKSLLEKHSQLNLQILGLVSNAQEAFELLTALQPDLLIVDYDDDQLNQEEFLQQFIKSTSAIRIVLLSLKEGTKGSEAIVYDRRFMTAEKIEDWLKMDSTEGVRRGDIG